MWLKVEHKKYIVTKSLIYKLGAWMVSERTNFIHNNCRTVTGITHTWFQLVQIHCQLIFIRTHTWAFRFQIPAIFRDYKILNRANLYSKCLSSLSYRKPAIISSKYITVIFIRHISMFFPNSLWISLSLNLSIKMQHL